MKTFLTAAILAALTISAAFGQEPVKTNPTDTPTKTTVEVITIERLGQMLETMGYNPRPSKDQNGKVRGYYIEQKIKAGTATFYLSVSGTGSKTTVWIDANVAVFSENNAATVPMLLGFLAEQDKLWPAYLVYYPKDKVLQLAMPLQNANPNATTLGQTIDQFAAKCDLVTDVYARLKAEAEGDKKGEQEKTNGSK